MLSERENELVKKFGIDIDSLKREQEKLSKNISLNDEINPEEIEFIGAFGSSPIQNKIVYVLVVMDKSFEVIDQKYFVDKPRFPYLSGFRAYRELPAMMQCLAKVEQKPSFVFIEGLGISHERGFGLASHFSLNSGIPSIAITDENVNFEIKEQDIITNNKKSGELVQTKTGSRPLFVSPGNGISIKTAVSLTKKFVIAPHKMPEPLRAAKRYAKKIRNEIFASETKS